ncbi:hypothetical protein P171DRAFT_488571 [Karstenula rhodostoma CBS 690.94]|uniref:Uncharacterized protein n=1 Tax=Karstenula rhodostoma CBS 690.94 TaxID=1392251 RepID=A0A9P4U9A1_9PLEO|nr:hypothetical protein P171DRAFT_488571 [Karstenula rhodostoma CBS 690.94]
MAPSFARVEESAPQLSTIKFADVPSALRDQLRNAFEKASSIYTKAALEAPAASYGTQYEIKKAVIFTIPKRDPEFTTIRPGFSFAESANIALLDLVIDSSTINFAKLTALQCEGSPDEQQRANPGFLDCHAVEKGGLSWGMDTFGCLSLCILVEGDKDELRREAYFVQRVYTSGEDGPRAGGHSLSSEQSEPAQRSGFKFSLRLPAGAEKEKEKAEEGEDEDRLDRMMETGPRQSKKKTWGECTWEERRALFWRSRGTQEPMKNGSQVQRY